MMTSVGRESQWRVALLRIEGKAQAGLGDEVYPVLELVGNAEIPHRGCDQHRVGASDTPDHGGDFSPRIGFFPVMLTLRQPRVFRREGGAVKFGQGFLPEIEMVDRKAGMAAFCSASRKFRAASVDADAAPRGEASINSSFVMMNVQRHPWRGDAQMGCIRAS